MTTHGSLSNEWTAFAPPPRPLRDPDRWNVFLSYRSVSRPWVLNLYDVLRQHNYKVFIDQCELRAGDELIGRLEDALASSQAGVLVWSAATADSSWVRREYQTLETLASKKAGFVFVPVTLDHSELPVFASNRIFLDFSSYPDGPNGGELLRLLHALVDKPLSDEAARFAGAQDEAASAAEAKILAAVKNGSASRLIKLYEQGDLAWRTSSALPCKAAEGLTKLGRNDDAITLLGKITQRFPKAIRPKQLRALALARRAGPGDLDQAQEILGELYAKGERDAETVGIYARTWMDRYSLSGNVGDLEQSRDLYAEAFDKAPDDYYTGINAAAKSVFLGTEESLAKAAEYAQRVQKIVGSDVRPGDYWMTATIAEVLLIQKQYREAGRMYEAAVATARQQLGSHETTWKQSRRLMAALKPQDDDRALIRRAFSHLPDAGDAA